MNLTGKQMEEVGNVLRDIADGGLRCETTALTTLIANYPQRQSTIPERVLSLFNGHPMDRKQVLAMAAKQFPTMDKRSAHNAISALSKEGRLERSGLRYHYQYTKAKRSEA